MRVVCATILLWLSFSAGCEDKIWSRVSLYSLLSVPVESDGHWVVTEGVLASSETYLGLFSSTEAKQKKIYTMALRISTKVQGDLDGLDNKYVKVRGRFVAINPRAIILDSPYIIGAIEQAEILQVEQP